MSEITISTPRYSGGRDGYMQEVARLRAEIEERDATIAYLRDLIAPPGLLFPPAWGLTDKEGRLLRALMAAVSMTKEQLLGALYDTEPETEIKIVDVFVCKLRRKLGDQGISITTMWGTGYRIDAENKDLVTEAAAATAAGRQWVKPDKAAQRPSNGMRASTVIVYTGAELRQQRLDLNLSQLDAAALAGLSSPAEVSVVERNLGTPRQLLAVDKALRAERRKRCMADPEPTKIARTKNPSQGNRETAP